MQDTSEGKRLPRQISVLSLNRVDDEQQTTDVSLLMVLLGKTGVGKSAAGNTILGQKKFKSEFSLDSVTSECSDAHGTVSGRSVSVVDTPGFFDTNMNPEDLAKEIARSVYLSSSGPHAFLIVIPLNVKFTEQELVIPQKIKKMFGQEVLKYSIILFTHGDLLKGKLIEELIKTNSRLRDLVDQCGGRYHVFNNKKKNRVQVNDLLQKIDTMIEQNGGGHYSNHMFENAQRFRREQEDKRKHREDEQISEIERLREFKEYYTKYRYYFVAVAGAVGVGTGGAIAGVVGAAVFGAVAAGVGAAGVSAVGAVVAGAGAVAAGAVAAGADTDGTDTDGTDTDGAAPVAAAVNGASAAAATVLQNDWTKKEEKKQQ